MVNSRSLVGMTYSEADLFLKSLPPMVQLVVATEVNSVELVFILTVKQGCNNHGCSRCLSAHYIFGLIFFKFITCSVLIINTSNYYTTSTPATWYASEQGSD